MTSWEARLHLAAVPQSVGAGRRFVQGALVRRGHHALVETATLLVSELLTNAVLHTATAPELVVRGSATSVRVEVVDGSRRMPTAKGYGAHATTGRGLLLVQRLAAAWGSERRGGGKVVWFELRAGATAGRQMDAVATEFPDLDALATMGGWEEADSGPSNPRARTLSIVR